MPLLLALILIVVTTVRHEGAHALMAWAQGVEIKEMRLLPGVRDDVGFYFGYVIRGDGGTWLIDAAPFFAAVVWAVAAASLLGHFRLPSPAWLSAFFAGLVSPIVDLAYNYQGGLWRAGTDVHDLLQVLPDAWVHAYFMAAIALCVWLALLARRRHRAGAAVW